MSDGSDSRIPDISVPLPDYVRQIATVAGEASAQKVIDTHAKSCPAIKTIEEINTRVKSLEDCKQQIKGAGGFLIKNWHRFALAGMVLFMWYKTGTLPTAKQIQDEEGKIDVLSKALAPKDVSTQPKQDAPKDNKEYQVN